MNYSHYWLSILAEFHAPENRALGICIYSCEHLWACLSRQHDACVLRNIEATDNLSNTFTCPWTLVILDSDDAAVTLVGQN